MQDNLKEKYDHRRRYPPVLPIKPTRRVSSTYEQSTGLGRWRAAWIGEHCVD